MAGTALVRAWSASCQRMSLSQGPADYPAGFGIIPADWRDRPRRPVESPFLGAVADVLVTVMATIRPPDDPLPHCASMRAVARHPLSPDTNNKPMT